MASAGRRGDYGFVGRVFFLSEAVSLSKTKKTSVLVYLALQYFAFGFVGVRSVKKCTKGYQKATIIK